MKVRFLLVLGLLTVFLVGIPVAAQEPDVEIIGGEDNPEAVNELLAFHIAPNTIAVKGQIYVASLPAEMPFDLPIPEDARIIGSVVTAYGDEFMGGAQTFTQIYLQTDADPDEVITFYETALGEGWEFGVGSPGYGFTMEDISNQQFCYNGNEAFFDVTASADFNGSNRITIQYTVGGNFECATTISEIPGEGAYVLIPVLNTPEGVEIVNSHDESPLQGGGGGGNFATISAFLRSEFSAEEIVALYQPQLEAEGWTWVETTAFAGFATSVWTIENEVGNTFEGYLMIRQSPVGNNLYYAELVIARESR